VLGLNCGRVKRKVESLYCGGDPFQRRFFRRWREGVKSGLINVRDVHRRVLQPPLAPAWAGPFSHPLCAPAVRCHCCCCCCCCHCCSCCRCAVFIEPLCGVRSRGVQEAASVGRRFRKHRTEPEKRQALERAEEVRVQKQVEVSTGSGGQAKGRCLADVRKGVRQGHMWWLDCVVPGE
jgi:hypothetical protein